MIELPWPYTLAYSSERSYNRYTAVPPSIFPFKNCAELSKTGNKNGEQSVLMVDGVVVKQEDISRLARGRKRLQLALTNKMHAEVLS